MHNNMNNHQPTQPEYATHQQQPKADTLTFIIDDNTKDIVKKVHPALASAMINIAIKKFTETEYFINYFVQDKFKEDFKNTQSDQQTLENGDQPPINQEEASSSNALQNQQLDNNVIVFNDW